MVLDAVQITLGNAGITMATDQTNQATSAKERERWLYEAEVRAERPYQQLRLSTHGLLLQIDARRAFLAGAWASVIVIAQAVVEASMRDLQTNDYVTRSKDLFFGQEDLERIRTLRNELLHPSPPGVPSHVWMVPNGDFAACHAALEPDAKKAYELMLDAVFGCGNA